MFHRTERLLLRPGFTEDAEELARAIGDEGIVRNLASAPWPYEERHARDFLASERHPLLPSFVLMLRTRGAPRIVGSCGIGEAPEGGIELGYWIARPYWGLGFATEAARAVVAIARSTGIRAIHAGHFTDNPASGRVLVKAGFRPTGRIEPRFSAGRGGQADCVLYELAEDSGEGDVGPIDDDMTDFRETIRLMAA
ncbi:MAG: GNAT family N-acetyltransferase [Sphingomonadales bacterium]|nr:GNAT family N-acetyltransferase [Sphingomonadales bacterium]